MSTEIQVFDHGPCLVKGDFIIKDGEGNELNLEGRDSAAICRCGASGNKPFCDGSHKGASFESQVRAG
ncbi:MAG: CDGSH iron-sulfur domain-containing protein [Planctomycetota bacterium]|jgi:CDGSH-type Zn-finger protein